MDVLLTEFMKEERWQKAIDDAVEKGIDKTILRKLCLSEIRLDIYNYIQAGIYQIAPPHVAQIPKDTPGEFRTVYINEDVDRVVLSILNDMLFDFCKDMIHSHCKSYQKGIGCAKIVTEVNEQIMQSESNIVGFKADLSKYFDSVPIEFIDGMFDKIEEKLGKSAIITVARKYYHQDVYIDLDGNKAEGYQSLKQGCALASFLADALLYDMDKEMTSLGGYYVRYSDDILYLGSNHVAAKAVMEKHLHLMNLKLNPKKFELLTKDKWFKFLGFNIKGDQRTLSASRVKKFQKDIQRLTIKDKKQSMTQATNKVNRYLYKGEYCWATSVLATINVPQDIEVLNEFVMDCIRACGTKERSAADVGGLGVVLNAPDHTIQRGIGRKVNYYRRRTPKEIAGYMSLNCMRNNLLTCRPLYETVVRQM